MSWFDEQIRQRKQNDQEVFEDAIFSMASVVLGPRGSGILNSKRIMTEAAIDEVLKYYHCKPTAIPDSVKEAEDKLEYALRPHGLMHRNVTLSETWYKDACGPMIVYRKEDGLPVVLLPKPLRGYSYRDETGKKVTVTRRTMAQFEPEALCFYRPLPLHKLGTSDLLSYMKDCVDLSDYIALVVLTLAVTGVGMMLPRFTSFLSDFVLNSMNGAILWGTAAFMLCVLIVSQLLSVSRALAVDRIQIKVSLSVEAAMMMRIMSLPVSFFKDSTSGELSNRIQAINQLCDELLGEVISLGITAVASLLYFSQIVTYAPALTKTALLVVLGTFAIMALTFLLQTKVTRVQMESKAKESGVTYAMLTGVQKIKQAGAEKRAFACWAKAYAECAKPEYDPPLFLKLSSTLILAVSLIGTIALYCTAVRSGVSPSSYLAFIAAYGALTGAFSQFAEIISSAAAIRPILELAEPILQAEPETTEEKETVTRLTGEIELADVSFRYNDATPYVIDDLSLKIEPGEYLAIVGATGCGKSTLLRLLLGFETPEMGAIYYDQKDLRNLDLRSLRRNLGVVTQDGSLFQGDIFSNITISAPHLTLNDAWAAAEVAGIANDIREMPMGMHTVISEGQGSISGGQKQRLMIARAIASKPKILLFDEATSALDNMTQKQIAQALDELNCTRIIVAHRLSTIRNCDRILVLDKGRIIESGTYDQLIEQNGFFAELVEQQRLDM